FQLLPECVSFPKFKLLAPQKLTSTADSVRIRHGSVLSVETARCVSLAPDAVVTLQSGKAALSGITGPKRRNPTFRTLRSSPRPRRKLRLTFAPLEADV